MTSHGLTFAVGSLLFMLWIGAPSAQCQTDISFDNLSDQAVVTTQYANLGVTFSGAVVLACGQSLNCGPFPPFSFPNVIYDGFGGVITATFDPTITGGVTKVSARITGNRNITMTAFDKSGNVLSTAQTGGANYVGVGTPNLLLTVQSSGAAISMVTFHDSGNTYTVDDFTFTAGFAITQPADSTQFPLTESSYTSTDTITFQAGPIAAGGTVQWTAQLNYATSGGRGNFQSVKTFTTDTTTTTHDETYASTGGKVTLQAKETGSNPQTAQPITIYIVGSAIPDADITTRLVALYGGATPNLMTGIAVRESTYRQFVTKSLFGISALWPTESIDGGSHIGLMQMPTTQADAWDWTANTADAVSFFLTSKVPLASSLTKRIIASHPGLRQLTSVELEHMAVCLYGDHPGRTLSQQYYAPIRTASGGWDWAVNVSGNPLGVAYADYVFRTYCTTSLSS